MKSYEKIILILAQNFKGWFGTAPANIPKECFDISELANEIGRQRVLEQLQALVVKTLICLKYHVIELFEKMVD